MRRLPILLAAVAALTAAPSADAATRANWNLDQQEEVADAGVLTRLDDGRFHGERPLTGAQLGAALGALAARAASPPSPALRRDRLASPPSTRAWSASSASPTSPPTCRTSPAAPG